MKVKKFHYFRFWFCIKCLKCWYLWLKKNPQENVSIFTVFRGCNFFLMKIVAKHFTLLFPISLFHMDNHIDPVCQCFVCYLMSHLIIKFPQATGSMWISIEEIFNTMHCQMKGMNNFFLLKQKKENLKSKNIKFLFTQFTSLPPSDQQLALQPAPLPGPRSYFSPGSQQLAPTSHL